MPMQPRPMAETSGPLVPKLRVFIVGWMALLGSTYMVGWSGGQGLALWLRFAARFDPSLRYGRSGVALPQDFARLGEFHAGLFSSPPYGAKMLGGAHQRLTSTAYWVAGLAPLPLFFRGGIDLTDSGLYERM